jgi:malonyl-CoA O-methyltransferase
MNSTEQISNTKEKIKAAFSESVQNYHQEAEIQQKVADGLVASLRPWKNIIPEGPILEVGCGTGFLTEKVIREYPKRNFVITDASRKMVEFTQERIESEERIRFETLDVDELGAEEPKYAMIVSNFAAQWFQDTAIGLEKLGKLLLPGGLLLVAFPGNHSFKEWYDCCLELGLPFTANPLPDVEEVVIKLSMGPMQIDYYENDLYQRFDQSIDFFKHIKAIGANISKSGKKLSAKQLKLLTDFWDKKSSQEIKVKWHIVYLAAKKDMI